MSPRKPHSWPVIGAWAITTGLVAVAVLLAGSAWSLAPGPPPTLPLIALVLLHVGVTMWPLQLEVRRQGILVAAGEIPLVLALFFLSPFWAIMAQFLGCIIVQGSRMVVRRAVVVKTFFNVANMTTAAGAAALVAAALGLGNEADPGSWIVLTLAVLVYQLMNQLVFATIITVTEGRRALDDLLNGVGSGIAIGMINAILGILILVAVDETLWSLVPLTVLLVLIVAAYRAYSNLVRHRRTLADLNDFTQSVAQAVQSNRLVDIMAHQLRIMLNAEAASVWVPAEKRFPELRLTAYLDTEGLLDMSPVPEEVWQHVLSTGESLLINNKSGPVPHRTLLAESGVKDIVVVPLRSGNVPYGCLAVANRLGGEFARFGEDDQTLLETLAAHTGVAVENSRLVDRLRFDAYHDALTELPNRRRSMNVIEESISITVPGEVVAIMLFDVSGMREINDSIGHTAGDRMIVEVGNRLREAAPESAHVGRIDGDEFVVVLRMPDSDAAVALAGDIRRQMQRPFELGDINVDIDVASGIAVHPDSGEKAGALLQRADVATQTAKNVASGVQLYNAGLESGSVRRLGLASDLRRAFGSGELYVQYQPKIELESRGVVGVECLARWQHPTHGDVPPEDFVPVAEHTGLLGDLTEFVLRSGLERIADLSRKGYAVDVSVNLSPRTLADSQFPDVVGALLDEYGVEAGRLTLEITEDGVVGAGGKSHQTLRQLRDLGVRLSVDDFGRGYSSLSSLRTLPTQEIKIDRSFVQGMTTDEGDLVIVRAIVALAGHFGMLVVAEGVESEMTLSLLSEVGCDIAQGFYFSRPLSQDRLETWLAAQSGGEPGSGRARLHVV